MSLLMHFRWGVTLVGKLSTGHCSPRVGNYIFQVHGRKKLVLEFSCEIGQVVAFLSYFVIFWI